MYLRDLIIIWFEPTIFFVQKLGKDCTFYSVNEIDGEAPNFFFLSKKIN